MASRCSAEYKASLGIPCRWAPNTRTWSMTSRAASATLAPSTTAALPLVPRRCAHAVRSQYETTGSSEGAMAAGGVFGCAGGSPRRRRSGRGLGDLDEPVFGLGGAAWPSEMIASPMLPKYSIKPPMASSASWRSASPPSVRETCSVKQCRNNGTSWCEASTELIIRWYSRVSPSRGSKSGMVTLVAASVHDRYRCKDNASSPKAVSTASCTMSTCSTPSGGKASSWASRIVHTVLVDNSLPVGAAWMTS
mmetsp:Transcript_45163/g.127233  ORF Transcript_45163/g.127233 Transcript_45163/m.127233 type:complete len:250 (-) Transcript_45163:270-1019(-)